MRAPLIVPTVHHRGIRECSSRSRALKRIISTPVGLMADVPTLRPQLNGSQRLSEPLDVWDQGQDRVGHSTAVQGSRILLIDASKDRVVCQIEVAVHLYGVYQPMSSASFYNILDLWRSLQMQSRYQSR